MTLSIILIYPNGTMNLRFSHAVILPHDNKRKLFDIQEYEKLILNVTYHPDDAENLGAQPPSVLNWTITSFNEFNM